MSDLEKAARAILFETLRAVDLPTIIGRRVRRDGEMLLVDDKSYDLSRFAEVILIGIGKASLQMGYAIESLLGAKLTKGLLVTNRREPLPFTSEVIVAGHPLPDSNSLRAGKRAIEILSNCVPESLLIFLISGGGSSLFESPISDEITLEDLRQLNQILVECGATIEEINTVRKQFSTIKGGKLRNYMNLGEVVVFLASDVNAGDFKTLASNPLFPEKSQPGRFEVIVERYRLADKLPRLFEQVHKFIRPATPEQAKQDAVRVEPFLLAENTDVVAAAGRVAGELGYAVQTDQDDHEEPYETTAARLVAMVAGLRAANPRRKVCVVSGGEVSCPVKGQGFGGRNQEFALHCALSLQEARLPDSLVLSCGTDGIDGRSVAIGAIAQTSLLEKLRIDSATTRPYFQSSDTASWFYEYGGLLVTGPTGNNLRDFRIILCH
jgi:glycerate 2-kinase